MNAPPELLPTIVGAVLTLLAMWLRHLLRARHPKTVAAAQRSEADGRIAEWQAIAKSYRTQLEQSLRHLDQIKKEAEELLEDRLDYAKRWADSEAALVKAHQRIEGLEGHVRAQEEHIAALEGDMERLRAQVSEMGQNLRTYREAAQGRTEHPTEPNRPWEEQTP